MQRRPSHPHGQLTGLIVLIALMLSVGIMFWLPSASQQTPVLAAGAVTGTPTLPITRTPRPERGPVASIPQPADTPPPIDWSTIPTAIPADQLIQPSPAPIIVQAQPEIVYQPAEQIVVTQAPVIIQQPAEQIVVTQAPVIAYQTAVPETGVVQPSGVIIIETATPFNVSDFQAVDYQDRCVIVGCIDPNAPPRPTPTETR